MLDSEVKDYKARVYGVIDALGTLGGIFEIVFWTIMLFYGSIRNNLYLFTVVNSLSQDNHKQDGELWVKRNQHNNTLAIRGIYTQSNRQREANTDLTQAHTNLNNQHTSGSRNN